MKPSPGGVARRSLTGAAILALVGLALAGCASLFVANPPGRLYRLTAADAFPANLPRVDVQLAVDPPQAPAGIDTTRIALSRSPLSLDYYADAEWTDRVPVLLQTALLASFENSGAVAAIDPAATGLRADFTLETEIRHFEAVYKQNGAPPVVWVAVVARLIATRQREIIAQSAFDRRVPATANNVPDVIAAFNSATDILIRDIVMWTLANPALSLRRSSLIWPRFVHGG
jgi:cholesterol transport system auxiliary component